MDVFLFHAIADHRHPILTSISLLVSGITEGAILWLVIAAVFLFIKNRMQVGKTILVALALEYIVVDLLLKKITHRLRPYESLTDFLGLGKLWTNGSFPSGHVASSAAVCVVLNHYFPRLRWLWILLPILIAWSRIYNGLHWPSDTLAGGAIGAFLGWLALKLVASLENSARTR